MADDNREAVEQLRSDMAAHQRRFAGEVTDAKNHALAAETLERLEREQADAKPVSAPTVEEPKPVLHTTEAKEIDGKKYTLDKGPDGPMYRTADEFEAQVLRHAMPRIERLLQEQESGILGAPSWRQRTLAAMFWKVKSLEAKKSGRLDDADRMERMYQQDLQDLLDSSCALFGDWRKSEAPKLLVEVKA